MLWPKRGRAARRVYPVVGRDGWLFLGGDSNDVLGQLTGRIRPGRRWQWRWRRLIAHRRRLAAQVGTVWVQVVVPDKETVYMEKLPPEIHPIAERPILRLLDLAAECGAPFVYPLAELQAAKDEGPVYHQTDSHWTFLGAWIAYQSVCDELERRGVAVRRLPLEAVSFTEAHEPGDLGSKLDPPVAGVGMEARLTDERGILMFDSGVHLTGRVGVYESDLEDAPTAVMVGTSYATMPVLFLKESFRRFVFVHGSAIDGKLLRREKPDVVIAMAMTAERGMRFIPKDRFAHRRLRRIAGRKPPARSPIVSSWRG